jgi:hypothetical protein
MRTRFVAMTTQLQLVVALMSLVETSNMTRSNAPFAFAIDVLIKHACACAAENYKRRPSSDLARFALFLKLRDNNR